MNGPFRNVSLVAATMLVCGCASGLGEREMNAMASALTKVSAAVDANVRYHNPADATTEAELLRTSVEHDPTLLAPFETVQLRVLRNGADSAVLVCERNGHALLEDAGCTAKLDVHRWKNAGDPCEFTLDVQRVCAL